MQSRFELKPLALAIGFALGSLAIAVVLVLPMQLSISGMHANAFPNGMGMGTGMRMGTWTFLGGIIWIAFAGGIAGAVIAVTYNALTKSDSASTTDGHDATTK